MVGDHRLLYGDDVQADKDPHDFHVSEPTPPGLLHLRWQHAEAPGKHVSDGVQVDPFWPLERFVTGEG